jgi:hypothetical protein
MKISKLLVLSALWLAAGSAMATVVNGVRQAPAPESTAFVTGSQTDYYYLYNTSANMFFTQGNTWGTRTCVGPYASAVKMFFQENAAADGTYSIQNYTTNRTSYAWRGTSAEATGHALFSDQSTSWGRPYWTVVPQEGNVFRLVNSTPYFADGEEDPGEQLFMGRDDAVAQDFYNAYSGFEDDAERFPVSDQLTATAGHHVDWVLVTPAAYAAVADAWPLYEKSKELLAAINEAKEKSIDVADEVAVYENEASTIDQMDAAIASIKDKLIKAAENTATPDNPSDMTASVTNPSYDAGTKGWSGTAPAIGYTAGEFYQKNYNMYQDVTGIPNGVYAVKVKGYFRPGSTQDAYAKWATGKDLNAYLYAKAGEDSVAVALVNIFEGSTDQKLGEGTEYGPDGSANEGQSNYIPNNMQAGEAYFNAGRYQNVVFNAVDNGTLRIGLTKDDSNFGMNWTMFDQWELSYLGNSAAAYTYWINEMKKTLPDYSEMGETIFTESYLTAYNTAVSTAAGTNKAEAVAAIKAINDANDALKKNIALWEQLQKVIAEAIEVAADNTLDDTYTSPLSEWAEFDAEDILAAHDMTNDALETLIKEKKDAIAEARLHVIGAGADVTNLLTNPNFQEEEKGWTGFRTQSSPLMPVMGGPADNRCAEAWNTASFDLYQVVENAPVGVYEISVQGFYRYGRGDNAYNHYTAQDVDEVKPGGAPCYVYMNAKATPFQNVFDEPVAEADDFYSTQKYTKDGYVFPDGMVSAGEAYSKGMYTQRAFGLVAKEGDAMRIGVKGSSNQLGDSWCIFDNFKLTWWGFDKTEYIQPVLEEELVKAKENVDKTMGKDAYEHLSTAIANAETALQGTEGKVMFDALSALFDVDAEVTASVEAFKGLDAALALLNEEMGLHTDSPALEDASNLMDEISGNISNHTYTDADVEALIAKINEMVVKLRIPAGDPTDANPVDFSEVITNATYDENLDGWTCEAKDKDDNAKNPARNANYSNVELFGCNYDYYQEIAGLPAGIYRVGVTGFFRAGSAAEEWARKDSVKYSRAFIYAIGENGTMNNKALTRLAENFVESDAVESGYAVAKTDTVNLDSEIFNYTLLANTMDAAGDLFAQDYYVPDEVTGKGNVVTVKVGEDGKLRFGLYKKVALSDNDWTIWANWKLWYFGTNSANQPSGDNDQYEEEQGIAVLNLDKAVRVETFTLDGRKVTSKQRGIVIQRMTMPDGSSVVIKKIRK